MRNAGVTLIELLLVIALVAILGASTTPFLSNFLLRVNLNTTTDQVISYLEKSQSYAIDNKNDLVWGTCISGGNLRFFSGSCESPSYFEEYSIPSSIATDSFDITFSSSRGEPSIATTIKISSDIDSKSVVVNAAGGLDAN